jgi:RNA polymerase sigma factor (sigma-70 family)
MAVTRAQLTPEEVALELDRMRTMVIAAKLRDFPAIPRAELENAYGDITLDALKRSFATVTELARFVHEGLRHDALDIAKSAAFRNTSTLTEMIASTDSPEHRVLEHEARELLHEFLAELSEDDRKIAYLHFDPDYDWTPRRIAAALDLPRSEVKRTLDRVGIRLRRFAALTIAPGALCSHRRPELMQWQQTGVMPLSLRLHLRRCHRCRSEQRQAVVAVRSAIVPLVPVATMPAAATGALARIYHATGAHPSVVRSHDVIARVRKAAPVGGGGGAAIAVKLAATTAVVTAGAALHAVSSSSPPKHPQRHVRAAQVHRARTRPTVDVGRTTTATAAAAMVKPKPIEIRVRTTSSHTTATQTPSPTTTRSQPPPAPNQTKAAPAPIAVSSSAGTTSQAARDSSSSSPPPPSSAGSSAGGGNSHVGSNTESGPAAPSGPPPP